MYLKKKKKRKIVTKEVFMLCLILLILVCVFLGLGHWQLKKGGCGVKISELLTYKDDVVEESLLMEGVFVWHERWGPNGQMAIK